MANEFKSNVGGKVTKKEAMEWIDKYDKEVRKDKTKDTKSLFYGRDVLLRLLSEEGSTGITFLLGLKYNEAVKKDSVQLILLPTREDGSFIWADDVAGAGGDAVAFDGGVQCPPYC
jgi:hypothetical protein